MKQLLSLILAFMLSGPNMAQSGRRPSVFFGGLASPGELSQRVIPYNGPCWRQLSQNPQFVFVPLQTVSKIRRNALTPATQSTSHQQALSQARALLVEGKAKAFAADVSALKSAAGLLDSARQIFLQNLPALRSNRDLMEAQLYLGATLIALKRYDEAHAAFSQVVYLSPDFEPTSSQFSPQVLTTFAKAKQEVADLEESRVSIKSQPEGASVYLNGRLIGKTPLTRVLKRGEYFFLIERPGSEAWYKPVTIERSVDYVEAKLKSTPQLLEWQTAFAVRESGAQGDDELMMTSANAAGADLVFLATLENKVGPRLLSQWFDVGTGRFSKVSVAELKPSLEDLPQACGDSLATLTEQLDAQGKVQAGPSLAYQESQLGIAEPVVSAKPQAQVDRPGRWYTQWWIYPLVIAVGVGAYFGLQELGGPGGAKIRIDNSNNL